MPMRDELLDTIERGIVEHGEHLGGWTRRHEDALQLFDGRVTLRALVHEDEPAGKNSVHAHLFATLHECDDEVLDACIIGMGGTREESVQQSAVVWITSVAGPIKSFIDGMPVCMTCQAGVVNGDASQGFMEGDYGLPGQRAYVGPAISRGISDQSVAAALDDTSPWFLYAAESAAPRRVHLAKSTLLCLGNGDWSRELEVDGHEVSYHDPHFAGPKCKEIGYFTRFAVFEFPRNSSVIPRRAELDRTILHFAKHYAQSSNVDQLMDDMIGQGFQADLVQEVESLSTIAFGRALFEHTGIPYPATIFRARKDGRVETDVPLMSLPAYTRARALVPSLAESLSKEDFEALCLYNAESNAICQAIEGAGDAFEPKKLVMYPCVVPEFGSSKETMDAAIAKLNELVARNHVPPKKKPWWKFW